MTAWNRWAGKLAAVRPDDEDGLQSISEDLEVLERLMDSSRERTWGACAINLWKLVWR